MEAARRAGAKRFVYSSSLLVYESRREPIDERTEARSTAGYGRAKLEAESRLREMAEESGIALGIIRLPHVYGARDLMFEQVKRGRVYHPGRGRNVFSHLHVEDAARLLVGVAETDWAGTLPVADDLPASWLEFFGEIQKYYPRFRELRAPAWNLTLPVSKRLLWDQIGVEPRYPTIREGIPAVLDECVSFQWIHPLADRTG